MTNDKPASFLKRVEELKRANAPQSPRVPVIDITRTSAYVQAALRAELSQLSISPNGGRNHALNVAALKLARLPIDRDQLRDSLIEACQENGLAHDDGLRSVEATITSAFTKADIDGPRPIPERPDNVMEVTAEHITGGDPAPTSDADLLHQRDVAHELRKLRVRDEAQQLLAQEKRAHAPIPSALTLSQLLAQADVGATYRIDRLLPTGGRALLAAKYKAGKSTIVANLIRSLVDGTPFLGQFDIATPARVVLLDDELDHRQLRRWLRDQGITNTDAVHIVSLRGRVSSFNILNPETMAQWAEQLRGADIVILDCLRPVLDALGLDESREAGQFLIAFDELLRAAGLSEAVIVHHMGHNGERSRGDSRLLDWPDVLWKIVRDRADDEDTPDADRYFSAYGRDVDVREGKLDYTPETRALYYLDTDRKESAGRAVLPDLIEVLTDAGEGLSGRQLEAALTTRGHAQKTVREAVRLALKERITYTVDAARNAKIHFLNPSTASVRHSALPVRQRGESECVSASIETHSHSLPTQPTPVRHDALTEKSDQ